MCDLVRHSAVLYVGLWGSVNGFEMAFQLLTNMQMVAGKEHTLQNPTPLWVSQHVHRLD
jgi:hypothetical protein